MKQLIIWHKWRDPLATYLKNYKDDEEEHEEAHATASRDDFLADDDVAFHDKVPDKNKGLGPGIIGPMGFVPLYEENTPSKLYNFWMGHTTFDIDEEAKDAIEKVPGVEILDVFTRYRFRLGVAKAFKGHEVREAINKVARRLYRKKKSARAKAGNKGDPLATAKALMASRYPYWAIFVMADGRIQMCGGDSSAEVVAKGQKYASVAKEVVQSWPRV